MYDIRVNHKALIVVVLFIAMIVALSLTITNFQMASAYPTKPAECKSCHTLDSNTWILVTRVSETDSDITYKVSGSDNYNSEEGWAVFNRAGTNIAHGYNEGTFTLPKDGQTYCVYWVDDANSDPTAPDPNRGGSTYKNITTPLPPPPPDTEPPTVTITYPEDGATLSIGTFMATWTATDNVGVVDIVVYLNGVYQGETVGSSWDFVGLAEGSYSLTIESYDAAGNMGSDTNTFTLSTADTEPPTVTITYPEDGAVLDTRTFTATWTTTGNVGVEYSEVYLNGMYQGQTAGYSWTFTDLPNGDYTLMIKSFDAAGNWGSDSNSFTVSVPPPPEMSAKLTGVGRRPGSIVPGKPMTFKARVKNTGTQNIQFYVNFTIKDSGGNFMGWIATPITVEPAGNGPSSAITSWSVPANALPGTYTVEVTLYYNALGETDWIQGNTLTTTFKVRLLMCPPKHVGWDLNPKPKHTLEKWGN